MRLYHITIYLLFAWVFFGSLILIYMQNIDGSLIGKPATFYVDIQNFKTDKQIYTPGDTVSIFTSYCRNRAFEAHTTWRLINETQITFPEKSSLMGPGCTKDKWVAVGTIPPYAIAGPHHLEGVSALKISPFRTVYLNFRSVEFNVI